ncbi:MAG: methyl-accepting chemotaxis protein [Treponema sp.]|nr:methyl-accepting chemotaxis protein [Treponema sp.]
MQKKLRHLVLAVAIAIVVVADLLIVSAIARSSFKENAREQMNLYAQLRTLEFEASMNEQLTLVRQMVKTPSIVKYLINPRDEENRSVAFEDFLTFQNSFLSKSVFWTSDADLEFWSGMEYSYTVNPSDPNDYWYNMTLYETDEYNFNINYNEALNATMLWVNAVVRDSTGKPVGMAGTGIPLQNFIDTMYGGLNKRTTMYLYNDKDEVTGALDSSILKDKLSVYDMLPYLKSTDTKPENLSFSSTREGEYLVAPLSLVRWHMALFMPYTFADCIKNAVVPFVTSALIIAVIAILATAILSIIGQLTVLKNAVAELSSGNADLTKRVSVSGRSIFRVFGELVSEENNFIKKLQELVGAMKNSKQSLITAGNQLNEGTGDTETAIEQISESINGVSENLSRQNRCVEQTLESVQVILGKIKSLETLVVSQGQAAKEAASAVETMISNIDEVNNSVDKMASSFDTLASDAESGAKTQTELQSQITEIETQSKLLSEANTAIANIAEQTNLLAMNAAIEAAHAGEAGKGFAVVADEIRKLSETSSTQSKTIGDQLKHIQDTIETVVQATQRGVQGYNHLANEISATETLVRQIKNTMSVQQQGSAQITDALRGMNASTEQVQKASQEMTEGSRAIMEEVDALQEETLAMKQGMDEVNRSAGKISETGNSLADISKLMDQSIGEIDKLVDQFTV